MTTLIFTLIPIILSTGDPNRGFQYTACLSNNGKDEEEYGFFFKSIKDKIINLYMKNSKEEIIKTSDFLIVGVSPEIMLNFTTKVLPSLKKNSGSEYICSYIKSIKINDVSDNYFNKLNHLIDIVNMTFDDKIFFNDEYETEICHRRFKVRNEKITEKIVSKMVSNIEAGGYERNENLIDNEIAIKDTRQNNIDTNEWKLSPEFVIINDKKITDNDFMLISQTIKKKIDQKIFKPGNLFKNFFRNFYKEEIDLFSLISNYFFNEKLFLKEEFIENIFKIKYKRLKELFYEIYRSNVIDYQLYAFPDSRDKIDFIKEKVIKTFEEYITKEDWNDYLNELRLIQNSMEKNRNYIIISTSSSFDDMKKNNFIEIVTDNSSVNLLIKLSFFKHKISGEIKDQNMEELLSDAAFGQLARTCSNKIKQETVNEAGEEIIIEWRQFEQSEYDFIDRKDEYIYFNDNFDNSFTQIDFKNFNLKIFEEKEIMKFVLNSKIDEIQSYKFEIVLNMFKFFQFTLYLYSDKDKLITLHGLDPITWILSLIEIFLYEKQNMMINFRSLKPWELSNEFNYYLDYYETSVGRVYGKFDYIDRLDFLEKFMRGLYRLKLNEFELNKNFMMTNKGFSFKSYSFADILSEINVSLLNKNEVISFIKRQINADNRRKIKEMFFETCSLIDLMVEFKPKEKNSMIVILRMKCSENLEDNRIVDFINDLFQKALENFKKEHKKTIVYDFLTFLVGKNISTCSYNTSYKISKYIYDKDMQLSDKLRKIVEISTNCFFNENLRDFINEKGLYKIEERDVRKELYSSVFRDIKPKIKEVLLGKLRDSRCEKKVKSKAGGSCVFELSLFSKFSENGHDIDGVVSGMSKWLNKI